MVAGLFSGVISRSAFQSCTARHPSHVIVIKVVRARSASLIAHHLVSGDATKFQA